MNNTYPKISIVTPSYNQGQYLEQTILSVIGQNYPNLEYIIIDGGSTDNSIEIIKKYERYLAYWVSEKDKGHYHAVQKGFDKSTGEIMSWLNSDDILQINSLWIVAEIFDNHKDIEWISGLPALIDETGRLVTVAHLPKWNKYRYYRYDYKYIQQEGIFWRYSLWEKTCKYINLNYTLASDLELWLRFFQYTELYYVETIIGCFRMRNQNQRSLEMMDQYLKEANQIIDNHTLKTSEKKELSRVLLIEKICKILPLIKSWNWFMNKFYYNSLVFRFPKPLRYYRKEKKFNF
jgi:glycosyltransferase involved in cell wall biosynthesis